MKRFTLSVFLLSASNLLCSAQIKGDMNDDNVLDITDVTMLIQKILTSDIILECPDDNHPHQIDLGLPSGTKWACCNVGATTPEDYGGYYSWGETEAKSDYMWTAYSHCDGTYETCHDLGSDIAGTQYDVAHVKWGGSWKMPTLDQINELNDNCTWLWTSKNNINGYKVTGTNGRTIFLPAAGYRYDSDLYAHGTYGYYWSSSQYTDSYDSAYYLDLGSESHDYYDGSRNDGQCVRPVIEQ